MKAKELALNAPFPPGYRASGVLLHVTSLPSRFGVGDLGPSAFAWIDRLAAAGQGWWQVLPLGPTGYGHSPYQALSSFAATPLVLSPDRLIEEGLLEATDCELFPSDSVDFERVVPFKEQILIRAWQNFKGGARQDLKSEFELFCAEQVDRPEEPALFMALRAKFQGVPFSEWPRGLAKRVPSALAEAEQELNGGGVAVNSTGTVFGTPLPANFGTYDKVTGVYTDIANPAKPTGRGYGALAFNGSVLYGLNIGTATLSPHLVTIDTATGAVTDLGSTVASLDAIAFSPAATVLAGDYNNNGKVDAADYPLWRKNNGTSNSLGPNDPIGVPITSAQYTQWRANFGNSLGSGVSVNSVPEPATLLLLMAGMVGLFGYRRKPVARVVAIQ
jgi:4-alpha-glucanotransferase/PEP-CTERM motif